MASDDKAGNVWSDDELDAIVADYFSMLAAEQAQESYVKSHHAAALMDRIGRTHGSIEFKHANISAVLEELGLPTIGGYKPRSNYQNAIFPAIERFLDGNPSVFLPRSVEQRAYGVADGATLFEEAPPARGVQRPPRPEGLERLVRKFDPVERDFRNRALGKAGEALVFDFEQRRLRDANRTDLANQVRWVAQEDGDGAGYDIRSFDNSGRERFIEVKTTNGGQTTPFFLTRNEEALSRERPTEFRIFRLYEFGKETKLFKLKPPLSEQVVLETQTWRAGFGSAN